jgi:DNA-directed RNA polymerase subunit RPC12/RpoP
MLYQTATNPSRSRYTIAYQSDIPAECPDCGSDRVIRKRSIFGVIIGWTFVMIGFLGAIPTLGVSIILGLWGVFLMVPKLRCKACGWKKRTT